MTAHPRAERIVAAARGWIGTPYLHQASLKGVGCDCLGLVRGVWRELIGPEAEPVPAYSPDWAEASGIDRLMEAAMRLLVRRPDGVAHPGDVMLFRWRDDLPAKHAAILVAPGRIVHAHDGLAVTEVALGLWWMRHVAGVFAFPE
jgi:NlpC/P60 family putative phage cell wall peptidase